jgi:hypothetical protein
MKTKNGWWSVDFVIHIDKNSKHQIDVQFDDLDEATQNRIVDMIREGYTSGELTDVIVEQ